jgi:hypothetical protein
MPCHGVSSTDFPIQLPDREIRAIYHLNAGTALEIMSFPLHPFCGTLLPMGSKDKGRKEVKKAPKPKPKPEPAQKREVFTPAPPK